MWPTAEDAVDVIMALKEKMVFYEKAAWRIYNFNIEPSIDYDAVRSFLESKEEEGLLWLIE